MTPLTVPQTADDITAEWLEQALSETSDLAGAKVLSVNVQDFGEGRGKMGQTLRLQPVYNGNPGDAPASIVAKLPTFDATAGPQERSLLGVLYSNEIRWYRDLAARCPVRVPGSYWGGMEPEAGRFCLLLEDLGALRTENQVESCTTVDARLVVEALAKLHAASWGGSSLESHVWLRGADQAGATFMRLWELGWGSFQASFDDELLSEFVEIGDRIGQEMLSLNQRAAASATTLVHGDCRLENFLFDDEATTANKLCLLDWQGVHRGSGPGDLAYFISQSLTVELRREMEDDLLRLYHDTLREGGVADYSFRQCYDDYRIGLLVGLAIPINGARMAQAQAGDGVNGSKSAAPLTFRRNVAAILDNDAQAMLER